MLKEFRDFIMRGNVLDLAVAVIIGGAFGGVINSLVNDVLMPPLGILLGGVDFSDLAIVLKAAEGETPAVTLGWGKFVQSIINFLIIAFSIFMILKAYNKAATLAKKKEEEAAPAAPAEPAEDIKLLTEIRDLLKK
jgi:large conductance mechanosensitive channel